jgi:DNA-binding transcriptional LysR family regulator
LNLPKSSVSRHVARLEARLGVRLLERSTRKLRVSEVGREYYSRCRAILADLDLADRDVSEHRSKPAGIIRVSCPTGIAQYGLAFIVPGFMARYPLVRVQILATNRLIDLIEDKVDVAIRARTRLQDEALTMRKLGTSRLIFVASPDLPFLSFQEETARPSWKVTGPDGETQIVTFDPVLWTSDFTILLEAACSGTGVALLPAQVVERALSERRLVRILPEWHSESVTIHLVFMTKRGLTSAVRVFINYLAAQFKVIWEERG